MSNWVAQIRFDQALIHGPPPTPAYFFFKRIFIIHPYENVVVLVFGLPVGS